MPNPLPQAFDTRLACVAAVTALAAMLAWCASVALQSDFSQVVRAGTDDAFYYFTAARNLAAGHGLTVDGIHPTNGFHPLWLLLLVAVYLAQLPLDTSVRVILLLQAALLATGAIVLYRSHRLMFSARTALASTVLFLLFVVPSSVAGMESALLVMLLVLLYRAGAALYRHPEQGRAALLVGVLLGLTLLTRLDLVGRRDMAQLSALCGVDSEDVADMIAEIRGLTPKPGLAFGSEPVQPVIPDVFVRVAPDGGWQVELNSDTLPRLLVNSRYYT
ncbi:MAG: hypothetical protein ACRESY_03500, partial [Steroidobacteraceae bacterium]